MSGWLFILLALAAASLCPLHMFWQHRRGRQPACCPPDHRSSADESESESEEMDELIALRRRQAELAARIADFEPEPAPALREASRGQRATER